MTVRKPPIRAFSGLTGSSFSHATEVAPQEKPKNPRKELVLVHLCFDQERNGSKPDRCNCTLRIPKDRAYNLVDAKRADFLLVANPKTAKPTKFHRAIVVRRTVVAGETLFAVAVPVKPDRRDVRHDANKSEIRCRARRILQRLFSAGTISQLESLMPDPELDRTLQYPDAFLAKIHLKRQRDIWSKIAFAWWGNILGFHRLSENTGRFLQDADRGAGLTVSGGYDGAKFDLSRWGLNDEGKRIRIDDGRVPVANHRASYWNGAWDHSTGADPNLEYDETDHASGVQSSHERAAGDADEDAHQ
jgi:hypothetical protein